MKPSHHSQYNHQPHPIRARHTIHLSSIRHNYNIVSSHANKQKCSVITVVKADGYGHGSIETAIHLAEYCDADAFAVATLEEGIMLRKAFIECENNNVNGAAGANVGGAHNGVGGISNLNLNHGSMGGNCGNLKRGNLSGSGKISSSSNGNNPCMVSIINSTLFTPPSHQHQPPKSIDVQSQSDISSITTSKQNHPYNNATTNNTILSSTRRRTSILSNNIRIIVLGPPTNIPHDFNLYLHYNIEVMISSTKMARALMEWVADCDSRKIAEVDHVANERKLELLDKKKVGMEVQNAAAATTTGNRKNENGISSVLGGCKNTIGGEIGTNTSVVRGQAATLTSMEGNALGKEVRALLNKAKDVIIDPPELTINNHNQGMKISNPTPSSSATSTYTNNLNGNASSLPPKNPNSSPITPTNNTFQFKGIEDIAKESRIRELGVAKITAHITGEDDDNDDDDGDDNDINILQDETKNTTTDVDSVPRTSPSSSFGNLIINENELDDSALVSTISSAVANIAVTNGAPMKTRKKIRWHALIDTGMGRLGFKSIEDENDDTNNRRKDPGGGGPVSSRSSSPVVDDGSTMFFHGGNKIGPDGMRKKEAWKNGPNKETVSIIKSMCHAEIDGAPIEFYGLCTHMAEASSNSSYTHEQMTRFKSLLKSVRQTGLSIPSISTDNSAALLTPTLTHFDPVELLTQPHCDTRGYVRSGGAIYGQRPAFTQLKAVSTLTASVRHIAVMEKGESVGYDRAYIAERKVKIATLSIGFADGYPRELGNGKGKVSIHGKIYPIAGNVCMDMLMVDLGCIIEEEEDEAAAFESQVCVGDTAYLWGPESNQVYVSGDEGNIRLQDIAKTLNTTQSALTCGLDQVRVQRHYVI